MAFFQTQALQANLDELLESYTSLTIMRMVAEGGITWKGRKHMSYIDLQTALSNWHYDPERISVRKIRGGDAAAKIQMRVELGILQMEMNGRPDGLRPLGFDSYLACQHRRLAQFEERNGTTLGFALTPQHCAELRTETSLFYRRFVALFVLEEFDAVVRDTSHNLAIFDICRDYAMEPGDRAALETFRPYVMMMDARARAHQALFDNEPDSALAHVNRGIMHVRAFFEERGEIAAMEHSEDLRILQTLASEVRAKLPANSLTFAHQELKTAIAEERFEEAARLRDTIRNIQTQTVVAGLESEDSSELS